jgi:hypothetical protein
MREKRRREKNEKFFNIVSFARNLKELFFIPHRRAQARVSKKRCPTYFFY